MMYNKMFVSVIQEDVNDNKYLLYIVLYNDNKYFIIQEDVNDNKYFIIHRLV